MSLQLSTLDLKKSKANIIWVPFVLQIKQKYFPMSGFLLELGRFSVHLRTEDLGQRPILFIKAYKSNIVVAAYQKSERTYSTFHGIQAK